MSVRESIVNEAKKYIGYKEGKNNSTLFGQWYGLRNQPWCAMFVSFVLNKAGVDESIVPKFASCTVGFNMAKRKGIATRDHITPKSGDIIFFVWRQGESTPDHVGLVEYVEGNKVHTIEGNRSDKVQRFEYDLNSWQIYGYARPKYKEETQDTIIYTHKQFVKDIQLSIGAMADGIAGKETLSKTPTISSRKNRRHAAVKYIQKYLYYIGYTEVGDADGIAGLKFDAATKHFQKDNGCVQDGEITARNKTWKKLLKLI